MCGIAGLVGRPGDHPAVLAGMVATLHHRGPDDSGLWSDAAAGVALGHRRLSIVDLSPSGHQPMQSRCGRYVLTFNGEIYNHAEIRRLLEARGGRIWRGHSDTETLVEAVAAWGLTEALTRCVGMFALALWDQRERVLSLARDRFGEKPLYYGWVGGDFVFASEIKALRAHPRFNNGIDRHALEFLAARTYIPAPQSIFESIFKLQPGCILRADLDGLRRPRRAPPEPGTADQGLAIHAYWSYREVVAHGLSDPITNEAAALDALEHALAEAIKGQAVADVPVGAFLSGGIDSSTIVALYQKYSRQPVRTFSMGFAEASFNEAEHAKAVARHLGADHHERYVTVREAQEVIPLLPTMYDEPFADSSQIPTHLVSRFAREQVKVALSGDAGDELFGGYNRYLGAASLWRRMQRLPAPARAAAGAAFAKLPPALWNRVGRILPGGPRQPHFGTKVQKAFRTMSSARGLGDIYDSFLDEWANAGTPVSGASGIGGSFDLAVEGPDVVRMMYCDAVSYLPDDIMCKVDRASMAVSLETRAPFLDHRVAALAARIPLSMKIRNGKGKYILRQLLYREAPQELFDRPKAGFAIPVGQWLRGELRSWAEDLLQRDRLRRDGYFDPDVIHSVWQAHLREERDATPALWGVLMFQAWQDHWSVAPESAGAAQAADHPALQRAAC
jgi:asparagine synthase (glutamine-hydrolysing)